MNVGVGVVVFIGLLWSCCHLGVAIVVGRLCMRGLLSLWFDWELL